MTAHAVDRGSPTVAGMPLNVSLSPRALPAALAIVVVLAGCGSSGSGSSSQTTPAGATPSSQSTSVTTSSSSTGVNPNQRESLPPGDIPDTIAYVPYTDRALGLTIATPEGWSRTTHGGHLVFTDKLNRVEVFSAPAVTAPTPAAVRATELPAISRSVKTFRLQSIIDAHPPRRARGADRLSRRLPAQPGHRQGRHARVRALRLLPPRPRGTSCSCPRRRAQTTSTRGASSPTRCASGDEPRARCEAHSLYRFFHTGDDETLALQGVSLALEPGEIAAVTGPSGSGKSTLLACLAGLDEPDGGHVVVEGVRLTRRPEAERARLRAARIGMFFQQTNLVGHLSVTDNVALAQRMGDRSTGAAWREEVLARCGIDHRAGAPAARSCRAASWREPASRSRSPTIPR